MNKTLEEEEEWGPDGKFGRDPKHAKRAPKELEEQLETFRKEQLLKAISIRLPEEVIESLRSEAKEKGIGYQTYVRMILIEHLKDKKAS
jgi:predicted DNA binding CopG/RHH family protein